MLAEECFTTIYNILCYFSSINSIFLFKFRPLPQVFMHFSKWFYIVNNISYELTWPLHLQNQTLWWPWFSAAQIPVSSLHLHWLLLLLWCWVWAVHITEENYKQGICMHAVRCLCKGNQASPSKSHLRLPSKFQISCCFCCIIVKILHDSVNSR